jgi:hypothetical protein
MSDSILGTLANSISYDKNIHDHYYITIKTHKSYYYCINSCGSKKCKCNDKDWEQGCWRGYILYECDENNQQYVYNIYQYLLKNFDIIKQFNRKEISEWIIENEDSYINAFYYEKKTYLTLYIQYLSFLGIFSKEFFEKIKEDFEKTYADILSVNLSTDCATKITMITYPNGMTDNIHPFVDNIHPFVDNIHLFVDSIDPIKSLQQIILEKIQNIKYKYYALEHNSFEYEKDLKDILLMKDIKKYMEQFILYKSYDKFNIFFEEMQKDKPIDLFYQSNNINLLLLNPSYDLDKSYEEIDNLYYLWISMLENLNI